mgnify:FL=1
MRRSRREKNGAGNQKYIAIAVLLCMVLLIFCSCGKKAAEEEVQEELLPEIVVGCNDYSPFCYIGTDGEAAGTDISLAKEAFQRMGYRARFRFIDWGERDQLLEAGEIDCLWCCFCMDGREKEYQWVGPYMYTFPIVAVKRSSSITTVEELEGKSIAVQAGSKGEEILLCAEENHLPQFKAIFSMQNRELIYSFLRKGYADALVSQEISILKYIRDYDMEEEIRILDKPLKCMGLGVAFSLHDTRGLAPRLDETLREMYEDGTSEALLRTYLQIPQKYLEVYEDER